MGRCLFYHSNIRPPGFASTLTGPNKTQDPNQRNAASKAAVGGIVQFTQLGQRLKKLPGVKKKERMLAVIVSDNPTMIIYTSKIKTEQIETSL